MVTTLAVTAAPNVTLPPVAPKNALEPVIHALKGRPAPWSQFSIVLFQVPAPPVLTPVPVPARLALPPSQ